MIKLIAVDFDSTIADWKRGGEIGRELLDVMADFIRRGGIAGIASGRPEGSCESHFRDRKLDFGKPFPSFVIIREAYLTFTGELPPETALEAERQNADMKRRLTDFTRRVAKKTADWTVELIRGGVEINSFAIYEDYALEFTAKDAENGDKAVKLLSEMLPRDGFDDASTYRNGRLAAVTHKTSGKGNSLVRLGNLLGIKPDEILAIGDSLNDLSMAGGSLGLHGGCVGNADRQLRDAVEESGGIVGEGEAWHGVIDVIGKALKTFG